MLGEIFKKARPEIQNPATLRRLIVDLIEPEKWSSMEADVKGDIYEGLLAKSAEESPKGAGQYFTPRRTHQGHRGLRAADRRRHRLRPGRRHGRLLARRLRLRRQPPRPRTSTRTRRSTCGRKFVKGWELVPNTARLCIMNLYLHGIDADPCPIHSGVDSLASDPGERFSLVLTNPPFGKKSSIAIVNEEGDLEKEDSAVRAAGLLDDDQEQATELPPARQDAAEDQRPLRHRRPRQRAFRGRGRRDGAAEPAEAVRRAYAAAAADRHLLRPGRQGERPVLRRQARPGKAVDREAVGLRLADEHALHPEDEPARSGPTWTSSWSATTRATAISAKPTWSEKNPEGRWRSFDYDELVKRDKVNLDIFWLKDKSLEDVRRLARPRRAGPGDRRRPANGVGAVLGDCGEAEGVR